MGLQAAPIAPAQFGEFIRSEIVNYARVVKSANVKVD